jgi:hypothetical protein
MRHPSLFSRRPATLIANIEHMAAYFSEQGLPPADYLRAAVKHPYLIGRSPATLIRHAGHVIDMHRQDLLTFPGQAAAPPGQPLRPLFAFLLRWPMYLTLSDDNYALRIRYAQVTGDRPAGTELLNRPRSRIERDLARALGQPHPSANA